MKLAIVILSLFVAFAFTSTAQASPQSDKMKACHADAKTQGLNGGDRKTFMKTCLKGSPEAQAAAATKKEERKNKWKTCSASASTQNLKGADRKAHIKTCVKG